MSITDAFSAAKSEKVEISERVLNQAVSEIRFLQRRNEVLSAKVDVLNLFTTIFRIISPPSGEGMQEDIAWIIERAILGSKKEKES